MFPALKHSSVRTHTHTHFGVGEVTWVIANMHSHAAVVHHSMGMEHKWKWECTATTPSGLGYFLDFGQSQEKFWSRTLEGTGVASGRGLVSKVGEPFELVLVDLLDDVGVRRRQHRLLSSEVLVKVVHVPFGFLQKEK